MTDHYIVTLWVAATIALCAICVRQNNEINKLGTRIESVNHHGLKLILNLQKVVYSDHEQIIICPHQVDRNRRLSKESTLKSE